VCGEQGEGGTTGEGDLESGGVNSPVVNRAGWVGRDTITADMVGGN
jgi:hypothetical protein